jgi:hypothetical protein
MASPPAVLQGVDWALESPYDYLLKLTKKCDDIDLEVIDFLVEKSYTIFLAGKNKSLIWRKFLL